MTPYVVRQDDVGLGGMTEREWLLATGHGGFAMGTASGSPRRKYHSLLNAPASPPVNRIATLLTEERLIVGGEPAVRLSCHEAGPGRVVSDEPHPLVEFACDAGEARWTYEAGGARIVKTLRVGRCVNTCALRYEVTAPPGADVRVEIEPLIQLRDMHGERPETTIDDVAFNLDEAGVLTAEREGHRLRIAFDGGLFELGPRSCEPVWLFVETDRGGEGNDRHVSAGVCAVNAQAGQKRTAHVLGALSPAELDVSLFAGPGPVRAHLQAVSRAAVEARPELAGAEPLIEAADAFLVERHVGRRELKTVLAGYPWFADWGRDTMIALPGIMLTTGRYDDALACLSAFAAHVSEGMVPNLFPEDGGEPHYNTVDASLWFLHAAAQYRQAAHDQAGFVKHLMPACIEIIERYRSGTRYGIRMDEDDGLIVSGDETTQLTWMDAKREGVVFTPRHGKAVEINALWHHGLIVTALAVQPEKASLAHELRELSAHVREGFDAAFLGGPEGGLHDCLWPDQGGGYTPTGELRINQIFAASLEHGPVSDATRRAIVDVVEKRLLTPRGMRTLAPGSEKYRPRFEGDMMSRDGAYHNGTAWPWLSGAFAEAALRAGGFSDDAKARARRAIQPLLDSMGEGCLGQIAEVFDAEPRGGKAGKGGARQVEGGCCAQAWSVAEALRALGLCGL